MRGLEHIGWLYDAGMVVCDALGLKSWRRRLTSAARGRTLELGCGTGRNLALYPPGVRLIAMDPDLGVLRRARGRSPAALLLVARAEALPFAPGVFDSVVSSLVLCSVDDPPAALGEIRRVLAPGGGLHMMEHVRSSSPLMARWQNAIQPAWTRVTGGCHPNRDTEASVAAAGFHVEARTARGTLRRLAARVAPKPAP